MSVELIVPEVGESITEVEIGQWLKTEGQAVSKDDPVVEIETDKVTLELPAPADGAIARITHPQGASAKVGDIIGYMEEGASGAAGAATADAPPPQPEPAPTEEPEPSPLDGGVPDQVPGRPDPRVMPAAARLLDQHGVAAADVEATGPGGRLLKEDVERHLAWRRPDPTDAPESPRAAPQPAPAPAQTIPAPLPLPPRELSTEPGREEELVPMTPMRRKIAANLVQAQQTGALLTTFNEVDMTEVISLRARHKDAFLKKYDIKLGFMSFFVRATVDALREFPAVNAEVRGTDIIYKNYQDIGIAIGGGKGLVVPILRNAERMGFAEIEKKIAAYAQAAKDNKIKLEDLQGGSFTITNGGIYGSMLSTPIINPPQSGVLGMHNIVKRPVVVTNDRGVDEIVIRPMMYLALTYDHRLVDGREAVSFLVRIKQNIEEPSRLVMEV